MQCPDCNQLRHDGPCRTPLELAAPDLLEALKEIVERPSIAGQHPSIIKARAAIAKATGGQP